MTILKDDALDRWMYKRDGMDYGPFTTSEMEYCIQHKEIRPETEIYNRRTRQWTRVQDVPRFRLFIEEQHRRAAEAARQAEIAADHEAVHRGNWWSTRLPWLAGAGLVVAGGVAAFFLLRPPPPVLAGYPTNFYKDLHFEHVVPLRAMIAEPAKVTAAPVAPKAARPARGRNGGSSQGSSSGGAGSVQMAAEVDLSFGAEDVSGGRELSQADLDGVQRTVAPRLIRCFRAEAGRNPDFEGGEVFIYLMPRGTVQVSRLDTRPAPTPELASCARASTSGVKVPPFAGAAQVMQIPLHVAQ